MSHKFKSQNNYFHIIQIKKFNFKVVEDPLKHDKLMNLKSTQEDKINYFKK